MSQDVVNRSLFRRNRSRRDFLQRFFSAVARDAQCSALGFLPLKMSLLEPQGQLWWNHLTLSLLDTVCLVLGANQRKPTHSHNTCR